MAERTGNVKTSLQIILLCFFHGVFYVYLQGEHLYAKEYLYVKEYLYDSKAIYQNR